jgi:hypothetical protein
VPGASEWEKTATAVVDRRASLATRSRNPRLPRLPRYAADQRMRACTWFLVLMAAACGSRAFEALDTFEAPELGAPGDASASSPSPSGAPTTASPDATRAGSVIAVERAGTGAGVIRSVPPGIDCGPTCAAVFVDGPVILEAKPDAKSEFWGWSKTCAGTGPCTVQISPTVALTTVRAQFDLRRTTVSVSRVGNGTGKVAGTGIDCGAACSTSVPLGDTLTLTATPDDGSAFVGFTGCDSVSEDVCTVAATAPKEIVATFEKCSAGGSDRRFVDHARGRDTGANGLAPGACAYRTLSYALLNATGEIVLAPGTYPGGVPGEADPYYLTGNQTIRGDDTDVSRVVFTPRGSSGWGIAIYLAGTRNGVSHCTFEGPGGQGLMGIRMASEPASVTDPHFVKSNVFRGLSMHFWGAHGDVKIENNVFRETPNNVIQWDATSTTSTLLNNTFIGNASDVYCTNSPTPGLTGSGNVRGGGKPICYGCANCPF